MKKQYLLLLTAGLLFVSCGNVTASSSVLPDSPTPTEEATTEAPTETPSTETPTEAPSSEDTSEQAAAELALMIASPSATYSREDFIVKKEGTVVYENYVIYTYDDFDKFEYVYQQITGTASLDASKASVKETKNIYYDGDYSYSLDTDNMYLKETCAKDIKAYGIRFDLSKVTENLSFEEQDFSNTVTGTVKKENAAAFLNSSVSDSISDLSFKAESDKEKITSYSVTYTENGYDVSFSVQVNYDEHPIVLPTSLYIKTA